MQKIYLHPLFWITPIILAVLIAPWTPVLDLKIANYFFNPETRTFSENPIFKSIYNYGELPAWIAFMAILCFYCATYFKRNWKKYRPSLLIPILSFIIGAGAITNGLLKDHWGRPRPKQIIEFGGKAEFLPFYRPNLTLNKNYEKSFPSGHAVMGFYFFSLALAGFRLNRHLLTKLGIFLGITLGIALSLARMAQGGHFFSDIIGSFLIMWLTAITLHWMIEDVRP